MTSGPKRTGQKTSEQSKLFMEKARELGCDGSEERFDAALRNIVKHKPKPDEARIEKPSKQTP